ncbi:MAG: hypothetical protein QM674_23880, partial [Burkholderiaceae bacterium]
MPSKPEKLMTRIAACRIPARRDATSRNPAHRILSRHFTALLITSAAVASAVVASPAMADASGLRVERQLTLDVANRIATAAVAACAANGHAVAATVVDRAGIVRA